MARGWGLTFFFFVVGWAGWGSKAKRSYSKLSSLTFLQYNCGIENMYDFLEKLRETYEKYFIKKKNLKVRLCSFVLSQEALFTRGSTCMVAQHTSSFHKAFALSWKLYLNFY